MSIITKKIKVSGLPISNGIIIGKVCHYQDQNKKQSAIFEIKEAQVKRNITRLAQALEKSRAEIKFLAKEVEEKVGKAEAQIFDSHIMILEDQGLINKIKKRITENKENVEFAVKTIFEEYEDMFASMDNEYMRDRKLDFKDLKDRVVNNLTGEKGDFLCNKNFGCIHGDYRIVLLDELTPSLVSTLREQNIKGIIAGKGGINSHAAIITRSLKIPYVSGIDIIDKIQCATDVILDADNGIVIFNPDHAEEKKYRARMEKQQQRAEIIINGPIFKSASGKEIEIYSNILTDNDIDLTNQFNLKGSGLVRTEVLFFGNKIFPDKDDQFKKYKNIVERLKGKEVTFRLFDLGGDKKLDSLTFKEEENPLLGLRGIRYLLKNEQLLTEQLSALAMTARIGKIKVMYPMISSLKELEKVNKIAEDIFTEYNVKANIQIGMMFEVPSTFINYQPFLERVDFGSIGTNDLIQYLFGVDRNNPDVLYLYQKNQEAVYILFENLIKCADKLGKEISICGEPGNDKKFANRVIEMGIKKFSLNPLLIADFLSMLD